MVRFILNNGNSTLEDGVYTFELDKRLSNATSARINKASFVYSPSGVGPLAVYLRSDALHHISGRKHTVELKNTQHENSSNILAVLEETHSTNRYRLRGRERVIPLKYTHLRNLDFYFTDPDGVNLVVLIRRRTRKKRLRLFGVSIRAVLEVITGQTKP